MYEEILVPQDGSEMAEAAIPHAEALAKAFGSRVTIIYVIEPVSIYPQPGIIGPVISVPMDTEQEKENLRGYLEKSVESLKKDGVDARYVIEEGDAALRIIDYSHETGINLIIMTTHGRSGIARWVYGSVADKVLRESKLPVLLIRSQVKEQS